MIDRAYKCRLYPNKEQVELIERTFGACRWVWNEALAAKKYAWETSKRNLSMNEISATLPKLKKAYDWLNEPPAQALTQTLRDLDKAYQNFFRRVKNGEKPGYPKFKKKSNGTQSYRTQATNKCIVDDRHVRLLKLGVVKCRITQPIEGRVLSTTVKRVPSGKYCVIICCTDVPEPEMPIEDDQVLGIDAGVKNLMTRSDGVKVPNHRYAYKAERKLRREQRKLSRRKKGSANWKKQKRKVAKLNEKVANQRSDAIHKATTDAVRHSRAIVVEDLNVKGMVKNHHLAKAVSDASMSEIIRQLEYKCSWYGRDFTKVDRWFPSSKTCGCCGEVFDDLTLDMREWTCPSCGAHHDRDLNAAKNIAKEGEILLCA